MAQLLKLILTAIVLVVGTPNSWAQCVFQQILVPGGAYRLLDLACGPGNLISQNWPRVTPQGAPLNLGGGVNPDLPVQMEIFNPDSPSPFGSPGNNSASGGGNSAPSSGMNMSCNGVVCQLSPQLNPPTSPQTGSSTSTLPAPSTQSKNTVATQPNASSQVTTPPPGINPDLKNPKNWKTLSATQPNANSGTTTTPSAGPKSVAAPVYVPPSGYTGFVAPQKIPGLSPRYTPGGISLSKAAADKMALHINIDGLVYRDGQIVVAGAANKATRIDAALFMTSLRLACEPSGDPYFSLDPFDGQAWTDQGREATAAVWNAIKEEFNGDPGNTKFAVQSFSVRQRYPALWAELAPRYPELRTKLVFGPEWLRETRFGEILYKADVLLKELVSGVSIVQPSTPLRAETVANYVSPQERSAARGILESDRTKDPQKWEGHRLWFDLMPQAQKDKPPAFQHPDKNIDRRKHRELYSILRARGLVGQRTPNPTSRATLYAQGDVTDLSQVYPKMFVRIHDHVTRKDLEGASPDRDLLSWDVNERTERYAEAYLELRDLIDIFRAYIAAAKIIKQDQSICKHIPGTPMPAEKVATPLPEAHPSEIIITVAQYAWSERRAKRWQLSTGTLNSGGIGLRGKQFLAVAGVERETALIKEVKQDLANGVPAPSWKSASGRQYVAFSVSGREPPRRVPIVAAGIGK